MILNEFSDAGYHVQYFLVNASKFGVPQKRERVIIIGFRELQDLNSFRFNHYIPTSSVLRDVIDEAENSNESLFFSDRAVSGMLAVREKMNKGRAQDLDMPCNTVSAHLSKVSLNSTDPVLMINNRYRRFSCREAARIQSFPDSFVLDCVSNVRQYKAIGNAVPPVMMWHIANSLQRSFEITDGDYDKAAPQVTPQYAFHNNSLQGYLFEQGPSYGTNQKQINK